MMMTATTKCECGALDHEDQREAFPVGTTVRTIIEINNGPYSEIPVDSLGKVTGHCNDGRAWVMFDGYHSGHTFHNINLFVRIERLAEHHDAPVAPERGETNAEQVKALAANWNQKSRLEQIIARHQMHDLSGLPNREYTASWEDVKLLIEQHSTLITQRERLIEILQAACSTLKSYQYGNVSPELAKEMIRMIEQVLTTSEQEGENAMTPSIKILITRFENAVYEEAMAEARDASDVTLRKKSEAAAAAKKALTDEFDRLQQRITELESSATTGREG